MGRQREIPVDPIQWAGQFAGLIHDPVRRLKFLNLVMTPPVERKRRRWPAAAAAVALLALTLPGAFLLKPAAVPVPQAPVAIRHLQPVNGPQGKLPAVWLVEKSGDSEVFSNGLRIDTRFSISSRPRSYLAFRADRPQDLRGVRRSDPAGIVFHTSESQQAPLKKDESSHLKLIGQSLIDYVRGRHAYNFLIDRFGRVYSIVAENQVACHAGYSVWSDDKWLYINLNESFLGISFEARTDYEEVNLVQVRASAMLTEMLRSRYGIPAENCVTHGQVSVNPSNMQIGYHTDWASNFPFEQLGLPNNYAKALPALSTFGFEYDASFLHSAGTRMQAGIDRADESLQYGAEASRLSVPAYRKVLQERYRVKLAAARGQNPVEERP